MGLEDFELALQDATACVEANPEFVKGYNRQAQAHVMLHQPGFAEASYRNGLAKDSHNPVLKQGLTQLLKVSIIATQASIAQPLGLRSQPRFGCWLAPAGIPLSVKLPLSPDKYAVM